MHFTGGMLKISTATLDGQTDGWTDGRMDGRTDGRMDRKQKRTTHFDPSGRVGSGLVGSGRIWSGLEWPLVLQFQGGGGLAREGYLKKVAACQWRRPRALLCHR